MNCMSALLDQKVVIRKAERVGLLTRVRTKNPYVRAINNLELNKRVVRVQNVKIWYQVIFRLSYFLFFKF